MENNKIPVYLAYANDYGDELEKVIYNIMEKMSFIGKKILVKPNFIANKNTNLSCTNPHLLYFVCKYFIHKGCKVILGDSPAFGSVNNISKSLGLTNLIKDMPIDIIEFTKKKVSGFSYHLSKEIDEVDLIVNVAKFKAHNQMGLTLCVKNLFGLVVGYDKLKAHITYGKNHLEFANLILNILKYIPPSINILDGIYAMEKSGPLDGTKKKLNIIGISESPIALDTVMYSMLGVKPKHIPLWYVAYTKNLYGSRTEHIKIIKHGNVPDKLDFIFPSVLNDISFRPDRVLRSYIKRLISKFF